MTRRHNQYDEEQGMFGTRGFQRLVIIGFVLLALGLVAGKLLSNETLPIRNVEIGGVFKHVSKAEVQKQISTLVGGNFFTVDIRKIQGVIKAHAWVDTVTIRRLWPDTLRIFIKEKQALARWSKTGMVSVSGKQINEQAKGKYRFLPLFSGPKDYHQVVAVRYLRYSKQFSKIGLKIRKVTVSSRRAWQLSLSNGIKVRLGRSDMDLRVSRLVRIYKSALGKNSTRVRAIDMRYTNGFAVKWKAGSKIKTYAFGG